MASARDVVFYKAYKPLATDLKAFFDAEGRFVLKSILSLGTLGAFRPSHLSLSADNASRIRFLHDYLRSLPDRLRSETGDNFQTLLHNKRMIRRVRREENDDDRILVEFNHRYVERPAALGTSPLSSESLTRIPTHVEFDKDVSCNSIFFPVFPMIQQRNSTDYRREFVC